MAKRHTRDGEPESPAVTRDPVTGEITPAVVREPVTGDIVPAPEEPEPVPQRRRETPEAPAPRE